MTSTAVKERPIIFSAPMVRAILDGRKTQTRRVVKPQPADVDVMGWLADAPWHVQYSANGRSTTDFVCPYGVPGDRLWVREAWAPSPWTAGAIVHREGFESGVAVPRWSPSIHMPRWASRITLEITDVRVQRLQEIGADGRKAHDVLAEGILPNAIAREREWFHQDDAPAIAFSRLWHTIHKSDGPHGWEANPWVWAITFRRIKE